MNRSTLFLFFGIIKFRISSYCGKTSLSVFYCNYTQNSESINCHFPKEDDDMDKFLQFVLSGIFLLFLQNNYKFWNSAHEKINSFVQRSYLKLHNWGCFYVSDSNIKWQ